MLYKIKSIWCWFFGHDWEDIEIFEHVFGSEYQESCVRCRKWGKIHSSHNLFP